MTAEFRDDFDRPDGLIGDDWLVPCGRVSIDTEVVIPVGLTGVSPENYTGTLGKAQVLLLSQTMDSPDEVIRCVWAHDNVSLSGGGPVPIDTDPAFTILARMTKDPLLVDLGAHEDPHCFDQGYGLRVTCPRDGTAPILKLIKYQPVKRPPNLSRPASTEPDGATVLATFTLLAGNMNVDPAWDSTGNFPYRGFWQDMRLRIRRGEDQVVLEGYLNDRFLNQPIISFTDHQDPLWSITGTPGFEFLSALLVTQPPGTSPYELLGEPLMRCTLFSAETLKDFARPVTVAPANVYTYEQVTNRVITLVEKNGDAKYNATVSGQTKMDTYLRFVVEAESEILRRTGFWKWLWRESRIYLANGVEAYEMPEDCGLIEQVRPGNFSGPPLRELTNWQMRQRFGSIFRTGGPPRAYTLGEESVNNRLVIRLFPSPLVTVANNADDAHLVCEYYARQLFPSRPSVQVPLVPQSSMDVLIYGAAAHALILDTDPNNTAQMGQVYSQKLKDLVRDNWRYQNARQDVAMSAADVFSATVNNQIPLLRFTQLSGLLLP